MPWDNNLNQDVHLAVDRHVSCTSLFKKEDEQKFLLATPLQASYAYRRLLHPVTGIVPSSKQIVEDIDKVFVNLQKIYECKGIKDTALAKRSGKRWESAGEERRGGKREKQQFTDFRYHADAIDGKKMKLERSVSLFGGKKNVS